MKKLVAILALLLSPAFAQEMTYTDPTQIPIADQTYTVIQQQTPTPIEEIKNTGGTALTLYDDGVSQVISLGFDFYFFGNLYDSVYISQNGFISFTSQANGCCGGMPLPSFTEWNEQIAPSFQYINLNNSIFAMWSDLADFNAPGNPYYKSTGNSFVAGWYGVDELGTANKFTFEISLFSDNSFSINYGGFDYAGVTGRTFTSGYQGDQAGEYYQIFNGTDPSSLQNTTYFVQSSEVTPPPPPPPEDPIAPDCTINPYNPTCVINDLTDTTDEPTYLADEETGSDDGSDDGTEIIEEDEEIMLADEDIIEDDLEELLADETIDETLDEITDDELDEEVLVENNATYRELTDEEKAAILADAISKTTIESALTVSNEAVSSSTVNSTISSNETSNNRASSTSSTTQETTVAENRSEENKTENTDNSNNDALDILETGRSLGQQALASTLEQTKESANDSLTQAENIAVTSNESGNISNTISSTIDNDAESVIANIGVGDVIDDTIIDNAETDQNGETTEIFVAETMTTTQSEITDSDSFADIMNIDIMSTTEKIDQDVEFVNQILAETNKQEEQNISGFNEDEQVTIQNDPTLANVFNVVPNTANLEILGVIGKQEDKSDAEKRAEEIVAANAKEQEEINNNYMDADQSGLIGAIAGDTDVTAYRTSNIPDLSSWYKPEDIYKNVVYKDNARGMYFLEKGNTDTYKKMVEEQYK